MPWAGARLFWRAHGKRHTGPPSARLLQQITSALADGQPTPSVARLVTTLRLTFTVDSVISTTQPSLHAIFSQRPESPSWISTITTAMEHSDPGVLFCSLHAHPDDDYPYYWGMADERGEGPGAGLNRNWPLPQDTDDGAYLATLDDALAVIRAFTPRYLVVSAGFDTVAGDPVGGFGLTMEGLRKIGQRIACLDLPTVIVQEGGYLLETLGENVVAFLENFV
jgi:hypothetical protein